MRIEVPEATCVLDRGVTAPLRVLAAKSARRVRAADPSMRCSFVIVLPKSRCVCGVARDLRGMSDALGACVGLALEGDCSLLAAEALL